MNTELRKLAKDDFEKDLFKLRIMQYLERQWKMLEHIEILNLY